LQNETKHSENHSNTVINALKNKLQTTTKDFSQILEIRSQNLKHQQKDRENYTPSITGSLGRRSAHSPLYKVALTPEENPPSEGSGEVAIDMPRMVLISQDRYISSRSEVVRNIEITIIELQKIFQHLATLVSEQGEMLERIDLNVDDSIANTNKASDQLMIYLKSISSNRGMILKMFMALIVFVVLFIIFFV